jgi:hypothetical protein
MTRKVVLPAVLVLMLGGAVTPSIGESLMIQRAQAQPTRQEGIVRLQLSVQMFIAGPTDESEEAERHRERARRALYEMAAKECDMLRNVIARDCRLESVNVNLSRQQQTPQVFGYQVMGNMAYQITLK